jgi:hypothetical protein
VDHKAQTPTIDHDLPQAKSQSADPLHDPRPYSRLPVALKETGNSASSTKASDTRVASAAGAASPVVTASAQVSEKPAHADAAPTAPTEIDVRAFIQPAPLAKPAAPLVTEAAAAPAVAPAPTGILDRILVPLHRDKVATVEATPKAPAMPAGAVPLGMGSIAAAGDPRHVLVQYVPVPVATLPPLTRMPQPPAPQVPQAPAPVRTPTAAGSGLPDADMANAFTTVETLGMQEAATSASGATAMNAFSTSGNQGPYSNGAMARGMFAGPPRVRGPYPDQPVGPMAQMYPPQAYPMMAQGMYPPQAYPMMAQGMPAMPAGYHGPAAPGMVGAAQPAPAARTASASEMVPSHLATLHDALYPSHREWAAENLAEVDAQANPQVVDALVAAAHQDPAASVRAACVRSLARMKARTDAVMSTLRTLKDDADPRVRLEADQALAALSHAPVPAAQPSLVPVGAVTPGGK